MEAPVAESPPVPESPLVAKSGAVYSRRKSSRIFNISGLSKFKNTSDTPVVLDGAYINQPNVNSLTNDQVANVSSSELNVKDDPKRVEDDNDQGTAAIQNSPSFSDSPGKRKFTKSMVRQRGIDPFEVVEKKKSVDDSEKVLEENVAADSVANEEIDPIDDSNVDQGVPAIKKKKNVSVKNEKRLKGERKGKRKADEVDVNKSVKTDLQIVKVDIGVSNKSVKEEDIQVVKRKRRGNQSVKSEEEEKPTIAVSHSSSLLNPRTTPRIMFNLLNDLNPSQKSFVEKIGFGSLLGFNIDSLPGKLSWYVADNFDPEKMVIKTKGGLIEVTSQSVNDVFGIPFGGVKISSLPDVTDETFVNKWKRQFDSNVVRPSDICVKIKAATVFDFTFKMNFLMVFANTLGICESNGICTSTVLKKVTEEYHVQNYDWCEFIIDCLRSVKKPKVNSFYVGPVVFLTLLNLDRTKFDFLPVVRMRPSFRSWKTSLLKEREVLEIQNGGLGNVQLRGDDDEEDEGFLNLEDKQTDQLKSIYAISTANKEGCFHKIHSLFSVICDVKPVLETTLDDAFNRFPDDEKTIEYLKQFHDLFKKKGVDNVNSSVQFTGNVDGGGGGPSSLGGNGGSGNVGGEGPSLMGGNGGQGTTSMGGNAGSVNVAGQSSKEIGGVGHSRNQDSEISKKVEDVKRSGKEDSQSSERELKVNLNFGQSGCSHNSQPIQTEFSSFDNLDAPTFSLGLSQGDCHVSTKNVVDQGSPKSAAPQPKAAKNVDQESPKTAAPQPKAVKRQRKPSLYVLHLT